MRINYRDLNNVTSLNSLSMDNLKNIWTPRLAFTNALGPFQTQVSNVLGSISPKCLREAFVNADPKSSKRHSSQ